MRLRSELSACLCRAHGRAQSASVMRARSGRRRQAGARRGLRTVSCTTWGAAAGCLRPVLRSWRKLLVALLD